ncbi:MAG: aldo/keto reductase [Bacteroidota bacterium]
MQDIPRYTPPMEYRRFGKTNKMISVLTLGGMRFKKGFEEPREVIPDDTLEEVKETVNLAFENGINHIETAYGYKKSEHAYGKALNELKIDRETYFLMTKGAPETARETRELVDKQLKALQTNYIDFYAWHGLNNWEQFNIALEKDGPVDELHKMKEEGIVKHVGFSTHAPYEIIIKAIETNKFEFVNLHYYYFFQRNIGAIALAQTRDMGVFIISPNDKGGKLFSPPGKLKNLTSPYSPMQWNGRFCLSNPAIHTLTVGMTTREYFDNMMGIFPTHVPMSKEDKRIWLELEKQKFQDNYAHYEGYDLQYDPSGINIPEILRMRLMWKCFDMDDFCSYRYNLFNPDHHWFQGNYATPENLDKIDVSRFPENIPVKELVREFHEKFYKDKGKNS